MAQLQLESLEQNLEGRWTSIGLSVWLVRQDRPDRVKGRSPRFDPAKYLLSEPVLGIACLLYAPIH